MSLHVAPTEHGVLRIFRLSDALHTALQQAADLAPLEQALEVIIARPEDVQIVAADSIRGLGLAPFLTMGYGVESDAIAAVPGLQDATDDSFVIVRSGAFGGADVTLADSVDATLIATLKEDAPSAPPLTRLQSESAKGSIPPQETKPAKSDARVGGMIATYALLILFALVALMIWIAS